VKSPCPSAGDQNSLDWAGNAGRNGHTGNKDGLFDRRFVRRAKLYLRRFMPTAL